MRVFSDDFEQRTPPNGHLPAVTQSRSRSALGLAYPGGKRLAKRMIDVALATTTLVLLEPLILLIAAMIKLDDGGAVLARQKGRGFDGQMFDIYKFRTLSVDPSRRGTAHLSRLGRMLKQSGVDELPQFFNVVRGEMSLVGLRPGAFADQRRYEAAISEYAHRHHAKPGITG